MIHMKPAFRASGAVLRSPVLWRAVGRKSATVIDMSECNAGRCRVLSESTGGKTVPKLLLLHQISRLCSSELPGTLIKQ